MAANHPLARVPILALGRNPVPARTQDLDRIPALSLVLAPVRALGPAPGDRLLVLVRGDRRPPMEPGDLARGCGPCRSKPWL